MSDKSDTPDDIAATILNHLARQRALMTQAVGKCLLTWTVAVELKLQSILTDRLKPLQWEVADSIWSSIISFEAKLKVINGIVNVTVRSPDRRKDWRLIYNYIVSLSSKRNQIAHGTMVNVDDKGMFIQPYFSYKTAGKRISIEEVRENASLFSELGIALDWINLQFTFLRSPETKKALESETQIPDLVLRLRRQADRSRAKKK